MYTYKRDSICVFSLIFVGNVNMWNQHILQQGSALCSRGQCDNFVCMFLVVVVGGIVGCYHSEGVLNSQKRDLNAGNQFLLLSLF